MNEKQRKLYDKVFFMVLSGLVNKILNNEDLNEDYEY
jgi:hypothetical protein